MKIVIIGGGVSGLTAAWSLQQKDPQAEIILLEKSPRLGGWIQSHIEDDFLFEYGPRSCRSYGNGQSTLKLIEDLGLSEQIVYGSPSAKKKYLFLDGKLREVPSCLKSMFASSLFWKSTPALLKEVFISPSDNEDESIYDFVSRRMGTHIAETFFDPIISGIYAGDIRYLSVKACFPIMKEWEQKYGSIVRGLFAKKEKKKESGKIIPSIFTLKDGLETITHTLVRKFKGQVLLNANVTRLLKKGNKIHVHLDDKVIEADRVVSTLSSHDLQNLIPEMKDLLSKQKKSSVAVVALGYKENVLSKEGFGYLIPRKEKEKILGVVWDSSVFPRTVGESRLSVMMGGAHMSDFNKYTEEGFVREALEAVDRHMGVKLKPKMIKCFIAREAIPQYFVGHDRWVRDVEAGVKRFSPSLTMLGTSFYGVAVNDCIAKALSLAIVGPA